MIIKEPVSNLILNWFHIYGRKTLPWKIKKNIYYTWISEIMLQQTQVKVVIPYFLKFIKKYPTIKHLSLASKNEILYIWSGLGYYKRAHNIYTTTQTIKKYYSYKIPDNYYELIKLPGIGKTTAHAILSFSLGYFFPILDGNIKRILIRYYSINITDSIHYLDKYLWKIISLITPIYNTDKFNQGLLDLGSIICTPKKPRCNACPLNIYCRTFNQSKSHSITIKSKNKILLKKKYWLILIIYKNYIWLQKRQKQSIWKGLFCFPLFQTELNALLWIRSKKILYTQINKKIENKQYKISNFQLSIVLNSFEIYHKKEFLTTENEIWFNFLKNIPKVGLPNLIKRIILQIKKNS